MEDTILQVSDFVALLNQTLEFAYPGVSIEGELANFRVSKGKWVYFDLKDEYSTVKFFGNVYQLPGPLEDGMLLHVRATPRLHNQFGFSLNVLALRPVGEGSIQKAAALLEAQLTKEGLFAAERKRQLPYPPKRVGLIASGESAAYHDFVKVLRHRWGGVELVHIDVQVQGEPAPAQIVAAIEQFNGLAQPVDVLVITRGGGSAEDLAAFSTEQVTRAVAASRVPTLVAIGHEVDISLAELAADKRASTPSNAAELLVPDRSHEKRQLTQKQQDLGRSLSYWLEVITVKLQDSKKSLHEVLQARIKDEKHELKLKNQLLEAYSPYSALKRGYAVIRAQSGYITSVKNLKKDQQITIQFHDGSADAKVI